jgi:hypothetical protein
VRLAERDQRNAKFAASLDLTFSLFAGANLRRAGAAAACQCRQRFKRRACSAEMVEQRAKGARADIVTADEAEPIDLPATVDLISVSVRMLRPCRV